MAATVDDAVLTNISEMIDLAIGTPENGVVDFNMLQTVLHCLAQQMRVSGKNVELRGSMAALPVVRSDNSQTIAISEFIVDTGVPGKYELATEPPTHDQESVLVVERRRKTGPQADFTMTGEGIAQPTTGPRSAGYISPSTPREMAAGASPATIPTVSTTTPTTGTTGTGPGTTGTGPGTTGTEPGTTGTGPGTTGTGPGTTGTGPGTTGTGAGTTGTGPGTTGTGSGTTGTGPGTTETGPGSTGPGPEATGTGPGTTGTGPGTTGTRPGTTGTGPGPSAEKLSLVTLSKFNLLENTVADLRDRVYGTSPKNEEILQEVRSQGNMKAITDMWTNMNLASRLDAAEEGIRKLSSLIEDLIGETVEIQKTLGAPPNPATIKMAETANALSKSAPFQAAPSKHAASGHRTNAAPSQPVPSQIESSQPLPSKIAPSEAVPSQIEPSEPVPSKIALSESVPSQIAPSDLVPSQIAPSPPPPIQAAPSFDHEMLATKDELWQLLGHVQTMRDYLSELNKAFSDAMKDVNPDFVAPEPPPPSKIALIVPELVVVEAPAPAAVVAHSGMPARSAMVAPGRSAMVAPGRSAMVAPGRSAMVAPVPKSSAAVSNVQTNLNQLEARLLERLAQLENEIKKCCESVNKTDGKVQDQMTSFQDQLEYKAKQIASLALQDDGGKLSPDLVKDLQGLMKLFETVHNMQAQLQQVHDTALNLAAEKEDRQNHIDALLEQIELLKVIKLDREDMVEALADKADLRMLARKVSHDQFENACDDLSKGLEHALGKLNVQESLWQQALDDIQREIEQKLDKMELSPVKDFFNNKLKQLQDNLKQMAALRREAEAAGTKRRLLRDVNCISCDAKAVMGMDPLPPQPSKPLPANLSMKPYLSYELDAIRKNQASSLPQRNLHDWEHVQQQMQSNKPHKVRSDTDKHLCNRYCGGSHTMTTPAQRVARLGHFIKQWGPEVLPLSSGLAAGDDGRLYKISTSEGANVGPGGAVEGAGAAVCTPKSPVKKHEPPKGPKPVVISAECRCLDPTAERPPPNN